MTSTVLPPAFEDLERFAESWCLATETERWTKRMNTPLADMRLFYDACFPRVEDAITYCDKFPLDDLPEDAINLLRLVYSLVMVSMAIEIFQQAKPVDSADAELERVAEPWP
ncbi:hypothetical protein [Nocardia bovistercoris]|uniref:Xaa-Pro dipeptidase n=1 Tax=Nocardia bovistercoris TaxID=2785916 RepID=A0A931IE36_9NOCA|nr:hypothetical protein [Nocardia bovistercoris]MBH0779729.1 hypothetical protein [Nocardia bovistercoris]